MRIGALKSCIRLDSQANEATRVGFAEAIDFIITAFDCDVPVEDAHPPRENAQKPITLLRNTIDSNDVVWFAIAGAEHILRFKAIAKLSMERNRVGDKYQILIDPKPEEVA